MIKSKLEFDESHSIFWRDKFFELFILKIKEKDAFAIAIIEPHHRQRRALAMFTGDEFSSLICEVLKYCFDLPKLARSIPCPVDLTMVLHGLLEKKSVRFRQEGDNIIVDVPQEPRLEEYHGVKEWELFEPKKSEFLLAMKAKNSKALQERRIMNFRIVGRNQAIKIQNEQNPALKVNMTMKKSMLDAIDKALDVGLHLNRQEFIASAIREKLDAMGIKHLNLCEG
jgi:hypothetical protein